MSLFGACLLALLPVLVVSARTTLEGAAKSAICLYCRRHFSSPGVFTLLVSLSLVVSGMCCSLVGFQLLQSPLTATSLKVLLDGGLIGTFPVFSMRYLMVPSRVFLLQPGVRGALQAYWKAASPGPTCRCLLRLLCYLYPVLLVCGVDMGVLCGPKEFTAYWQNDFELLYRTSLHCASRGSHLWPGTGEYVLRVQSVKCLFCGRSSEASSSSPWHGSRVMPERYSVGTVQELLGCGACGMVGIENWALRTVCKWSKSFMCGGAYGRRSSGFWCRVHLEFAYVAGCSLLVRHQGSHAWQSCAETLMVVGLVLASRSA